MKRANTVEVTATRVAETTNAILIEHETAGKVWIPLSQVDEIHHKNGEVTLVMSTWIAEKKGLL